MKPMLAVAAPTAGLSFPLYASAKLDGVRCVIKDGSALTRKLERVPNSFVQHMLGHSSLDGLDGELCVGAPYSPTVFQDTQSGVMSSAGQPDFVFHVFDYWNGPPGVGYAQRLETLAAALAAPPYVLCPYLQLHPAQLVHSMEELNAAQETALEQGYEGLILRSPDGPYKFGRSTAKQGWMMKLKRFVDGEAVVVGCVEMQHNDNELETNNVGGAKRSTRAAGLRPAGVLGAFRVRDCATGAEFSVGSGFDDAERALYWNNRADMEGLVLRYKHFEIGAKNAPRFPVFLGFRDPKDMGEPS